MDQVMEKPLESAGTAKVLLCFEWGSEPVHDMLSIGRDPRFSPLADKVGALDTVSRRHAAVIRSRGTLRVVHLGSTNPTYVNGVPLATGQSATLVDGDLIQFSRHLSAVVQIDTSISDPGA